MFKYNYLMSSNNTSDNTASGGGMPDIFKMAQQIANDMPSPNGEEKVDMR